jgi:signal transduction histidine kinase
MPRPNPWLALFVVTRVIATAAGVALLIAHDVTENNVALAAVAVVYGGGTIVAAVVFRALQHRPAAWAIDAAALMALILATDTYRSPFYLLGLTALILPATGLPVRRAFAFGVGFTTAYFVIAASTGVSWKTLEQTYKLESFATHLLVPLIIVITLAYAGEVLRRLQQERARSERLAVEAERRRIAFELHDSAKQRVHAAHLMLSQHQRRDDEKDPMLDQALAELQAASADIDTSLTELRTPLADVGLMEGVRKRATELEGLSGIRIEVTGEVPELPATTAAHAFRVVSEAMTNAVRHSAATCMRVALCGRDRRFTAEITDDGRGLPRELRPGSNGIRSMKRRARMLGGTLDIYSGVERGSDGDGDGDGDGRVGTTVRLVVPLDLGSGSRNGADDGVPDGATAGRTARGQVRA